MRAQPGRAAGTTGPAAAQRPCGNDRRGGRLPTASIDLSFSDILSDLSGALFLLGEARNGRFLLDGDLMYVNITTKDGMAGPLYSGFRFENEMVVATALGGYRLLEEKQYSFDVLAGLRRWSVDGDLRLTGGVLPTVSTSRGKN